MDVEGVTEVRLNLCILDFSQIVLCLIHRGHLLIFSQNVQLLENVITTSRIWYYMHLNNLLSIRLR